MIRAHFVKRARKARPRWGIKRRDSYWWWKFYCRPKQFSLARPRASQLTQSEFLSSILAAREAVDDALAGMHREDANGDGNMLEDAVDDLLESLRSAVEVVQEQLDLCAERADNVESRFPNGCPTIELLRERAEQCEALADELDAAAGEVEAAETVEEVESAVAGIGWDVS